MALPKVRLEVEADTTDAERGLNRVNDRLGELERVATIAGGRAGALSERFRNTGRDSRVFARGIQNAAFQLGDFATQVGAGTSASIALGQQLPQLFVGFGALGAVLGAVVAIAVPLSRSFVGLRNDTALLNEVLGTTAPMFTAIAQSMQRVKQISIDFAELIINNLDRIIITAGVAAAVFGTRLVIGFIAARAATMTLAGALAFLRGALIRTGIGALIVGAGELIYQFTRLASAAGGVGEAFGLIGDVFREVFTDRIPRVLSVLSELFDGVGIGIQGAFMRAFEAVQSHFAPFINGIIRGINAAGEALDNLSGGRLGFTSVGEIESPSGGFSEGANLMNSGRSIISSAATSMGQILNEPLESVQRIRDLLASMREEGLTLPDILGAGSAGAEDAEGGASRRVDEELTAQENRIRDHFNRIKALTEGGLSDKLGAWGSYFKNLVSLTGSNNQRLLALGQAFQSAQSLIDAWGAFTAVLRDPQFIGRPFARIAAAGQVLAAGLGAVRAIRSVTSSGGGGGGGGGSVGAAAISQAAAAPMRGTQNVVIDMINASPSQVMGVQQMVDLLTEANRQGYDLNAIVRAS